MNDRPIRFTLRMVLRRLVKAQSRTLLQHKLYTPIRSWKDSLSRPSGSPPKVSRVMEIVLRVGQICHMIKSRLNLTLPPSRCRLAHLSGLCVVRTSTRSSPIYRTGSYLRELLHAVLLEWDVYFYLFYFWITVLAEPWQRCEGYSVLHWTRSVGHARIVCDAFIIGRIVGTVKKESA